MIIFDSCMIWFHVACIMQLKKSYHIATNVCSRKSATTFGDLPDCLKAIKPHNRLSFTDKIMISRHQMFGGCIRSACILYLFKRQVALVWIREGNYANTSLIYHGFKATPLFPIYVP